MQRGHSEVMDEMSMAIPSTAEMSMDEMSVAISPAGRPWTATDEMSLSSRWRTHFLRLDTHTPLLDNVVTLFCH